MIRREVQLGKPAPIEFERIGATISDLEVLRSNLLQHRLEMHHASWVNGGDTSSIFVFSAFLVPGFAFPVPRSTTKNLLDVDVVCFYDVLFKALAVDVFFSDFANPLKNVFGYEPVCGQDGAVCDGEIWPAADGEVVWHAWSGERQVAICVCFEARGQ